MYKFSIMKMDVEHLEEVCQDIAEQYKTDATNMALFNMTLTPEGDPAADKATEFCKKYDLFRDRLKELGCECGILVQSTIGHGYKINVTKSFEQYLGRSTGEVREIYCPYDEGFRAHFKEAFATLAKHAPKVIMVDDDFRLMQGPGRGCACKLHMARFNELTGKNMTREELDAHIKAHPYNDELTDAFLETQRESVVGAAKMMREGIDSVDPTIQGAYCSAGKGAEFAAEISRVLAGKGNPSIVRLNNCLYAPLSTKRFSRRLTMASYQLALLKGKVDIPISENDSLPQNRYGGTGAQFFHSHFVHALLTGAKGGKIWITRSAAEAKSGKCYRKILAEHSGMYDKITELADEFEPFGCCVPVTKYPAYDLDMDDPWTGYNDGWSLNLLERIGLPFYYSKNPSGAVFLEGDADKRYTDEELKELFKNTVVMTSGIAKRIEDRGFSSLIGIKVLPWNGENISGEKVFVNNNITQRQKNAQELIPINNDVEILSEAYYTPDGGTTIKTLFPASTRYKNNLGGTAIVFCGTPVSEHNYLEGFSFLNETRKLQLTSLLTENGLMPIYYSGDAEMLARAGKISEGRMLAVFTNLGYDILDELELCCDMKVQNIEIMKPNGDFESVGFMQSGHNVTVDITVNPVDPIILILN